MPKKIKYESFIYRFLIEAEKSGPFKNSDSTIEWSDFLKSLTFVNEKKEVQISWNNPKKGQRNFNINEATFYTRGDTEVSSKKQEEQGLKGSEDKVKLANDKYFKEIVNEIANEAGFMKLNDKKEYELRIEKEREFHDQWAASEDVNKIDVIATNTVCTAPEMRFITEKLGNIQGKELLDVGCGLGEASVYFAMLGAKVTSSDLSQGMVDATSKLAELNGVSVEKHIASAEDMQLGQRKFDVIYAGNLLHHVDIEETLKRIKPHLKEEGVLVTWDPLHYNPAINVYRAMATEVRTPDEHPLKWKDIKTFKSIFPEVKTKYFWFTTLIIFVLMSLAQRRNPNKERYWKVVIEESSKWEWLYRPLEIIDKVILNLIPPLRLLCWNVVVISKNSKKD